MDMLKMVKNTKKGDTNMPQIKLKNISATLGKKKLTLNLGAKKEPEVTKEEAAEVPVEKIQAEETVATPVEEITVNETPVIEEAEEVVTEDKNTAEETGKLDVPETVQEVVEEESKAEEKPKRKRRSKKTKEDVVQSSEPANTEPIHNYKEVVNEICYTCIDEEWDRNREYINKEIDSIVLDTNNTPAKIELLVQNINGLFDIVCTLYHEQTAIFTNLASKEGGLIPRIILENSYGSNEQERKQNGNNAVRNYRNKANEVVDLFAIRAETVTRLEFLKAIYERLECKRNMLITLAASLKISTQ